MGLGSTLFQWRSDTAAWSEVADFAALGIDTITRLAIDAERQRLALVAIPTS